jgi:hypothetical protein
MTYLLPKKFKRIYMLQMRSTKLNLKSNRFRIWIDVQFLFDLV